MFCIKRFFLAYVLHFSVMSLVAGQLMVGRCPSGYSTVTQIIPHCEMFPVITTTLILFYRKQIRVHTEVLELAFVSTVFDIRDVCCCTDWICTHRGRKNKIFILKKKKTNLLQGSALGNCLQYELRCQMIITFFAAFRAQK